MPMHMGQIVAKRCDIDFGRTVVGEHLSFDRIEQFIKKLFGFGWYFAHLFVGMLSKYFIPRNFTLLNLYPHKSILPKQF